jgi:transposase
VALELQLNANMLRTWIKESGAASVIARSITALALPTTSAAFLPLKIATRTAPALTSTSAERPIRVHIRKGKSRITIEWPATAAGACASWLRELLG